jgi:hypothetical protein
MNFFKTIRHLWKEAQKNAEQEQRSKQRIKSLIDFAQREFLDGFYYDWESDLGQEFADIIDVMNKEDWLYFEQIVHTIPSETLQNIGDYLCMDPIFHKLEHIHSKKILCLAFLHCNDDESYYLSDNVSAELGTYVDLELSFLEKVLKRFEEILIYGEMGKPEDSSDWLKECLNYLKEKIENTQIYEQNNTE